MDEPLAVPDVGVPDSSTDDGAGGEGVAARAVGWCRRRARAAGVPGAVIALLLVVSGALGAGYVDARGDLVDRNRELAVRNAERSNLAAELASVTARHRQLDDQLKAEDWAVVDPVGYEKVRQCVQAYAGLERWIKEHLADPSPTEGTFWYGATGQAAEGPAGLVQPTICTDAEPYLR